MDSLRERIHAASSKCPAPLLPQAQGQAPVKRRPLSPMASLQRGTGGGHHHPPGSSHRAAAWLRALRLLASRRFLTAVLALSLLLLGAVQLHASLAPPPERATLDTLSGDVVGAVHGGSHGSEGGTAADTAPKLIPRLLHQTYSSSAALPPHVRQLMLSWRVQNPGWEVRFYDDQDCLRFVQREYPQYLDTYRQLAMPVERANLFRYLVVLRHGGVYADVDAECRQPLDGLIRSRDTLVVGWEADYSSAEAALNAWFVRTRQVAQWVFAGAAGHPALAAAADRIAAAVRDRIQFSSDVSLDTQERTGAGLWTDVVLEHADAHPPAGVDADPWGVRLLPRVAFGVPLAPGNPAQGLSPADPGVVALHHPRGAWRSRAAPRWRLWQRLWGQSTAAGGGGVSNSAGAASSTPEAEAKALAAAAAGWRQPSWEARASQLARMRAIDAARALYPVSAAFSPPFDLMVHAAGAGERQSGQDVSAALTRYGAWQPSVQPARGPMLVDAVVGSLGGRSAGSGSSPALVDVGAGYGELSLAAAARGHRVLAFELAPKSVAALEAAVQRNGFSHLVQLHRLPLGGPRQEGYVCLSAKPGGGASIPPTAAADMARGYAASGVHAVPASACQLMAKRTPGAMALRPEEQVGALRVSANGWEGWVLEGFAPLIEAQRPPVIALEWSPAAMRAAGYTSPLRLLRWLYTQGYTEASHSGYVCDERWYTITYGVRRRGGISPEGLASLRQPTWCRLLPADYALLLERSSSTRYPETLLLVSRAAGNTSGGSDVSSSSTDGGARASEGSSRSAGGGVAAAAAQQQDRRGAERWQGDGARGGVGQNAPDDAELEASVAAALAALARAEEAVLRPTKLLPANSTAGAAAAAASSTAAGSPPSNTHGSALAGGGAAAAGEAAQQQQQQPKTHPVLEQARRRQ